VLVIRDGVGVATSEFGPVHSKKQSRAEKIARRRAGNDLGGELRVVKRREEAKLARKIASGECNE
jgi:hypothetical protein